MYIKTDVEIIMESIAIIVSDKERFKKVLIATGIYDNNLRLITRDHNLHVKIPRLQGDKQGISTP